MRRPRVTLKRLRCIEEALWFYIDIHFHAERPCRDHVSYIADDENGGYSDALGWTRQMIALMESKKKEKGK